MGTAEVVRTHTAQDTSCGIGRSQPPQDRSVLSPPNHVIFCVNLQKILVPKEVKSPQLHNTKSILEKYFAEKNLLSTVFQERIWKCYILMHEWPMSKILENFSPYLCLAFKLNLAQSLAAFCGANWRRRNRLRRI